MRATDTLSVARVASKASRDRSWVHDLEDREPSEREDGARSWWLSAQLHGSGEGQVEPAGSPRTQDPQSLRAKQASGDD